MTDQEFEQQRQEVAQLATQYTDLATQASSHTVAINALLTAFAAVAGAHPCCTELAVHNVCAVAMKLQQLHAPGQGSHAIH